MHVRTCVYILFVHIYYPMKANSPCFTLSHLYCMFTCTSVHIIYICSHLASGVEVTLYGVPSRWGWVGLLLFGIIRVGLERHCHHLCGFRAFVNYPSRLIYMFRRVCIKVQLMQALIHCLPCRHQIQLTSITGNSNQQLTKLLNTYKSILQILLINSHHYNTAFLKHMLP